MGGNERGETVLAASSGVFLIPMGGNESRSRSRSPGAAKRFLIPMGGNECV